ncbi:TPA: type II secretion system F family protein [Burkholderia vietnamiensis]|nr:type II secretion system F family protein [Burkholderia vietnamiensis]HDR9145458.1 type II secretion system F family protein [Burkholderia vietnamiensis]
MIDSLSERLNAAWYRLWFSAKARRNFYRSMALLLRNRVSLKKALQAQYDVYSDDGKKPDRIEALVTSDCLIAVEEGTRLSDRLQNWTPFDEHSTIASGDTSGRLAEALARAGEIIKRKSALRKAVVNAVTYPSIIMLALGVTFYQISVTVMPKLLRVSKKEYWDSSTYAMQYMSDFVAAHGEKLLIGCIGLVLFAIISMPRLTGRVRYYLDKIPPWTVYRIVQGAIFLYNVCVLLEAGVSKVEILEDMSERASPYMRERIDGVLAGVKNGLDLGSALKECGYDFPSRDSIAYVKLIGSMDGGESQLRQFADEWMDETVERLEQFAAGFKQVAIGFGGILILLILAGANGIANSFTSGM